MKWLTLLAILVAAAGCQTAAPPPLAASPAACRAAPDGSAPVAERGSGGTGVVAERGSGGTGAVAERGGGGTGAVAERGGGGTGIVGIVSGFASVCIDGLEVALDPRVPVDIDGAAGVTADLRVGQVVAIAAKGPLTATIAERISVRHEVVGPVETVESVQPVRFTVAGQRVKLASGTVGSAHIQPGTRVAVSGLRDGDGDIVASRVDAVVASRVDAAVASRVDAAPASGVEGALANRTDRAAEALTLVHGPLLHVNGTMWIGGLRVPGASASMAGTYVAARGTYDRGVLHAGSVTPDTLLTDPPAWFGPDISSLAVQAHVRFGSGYATLAGGYRARIAGGLPHANQDGLFVLHLAAQPGSEFIVTDALLSHPLPAPGSPAAPARPGDTPPVPDGTAALAHPPAGNPAAPDPNPPPGFNRPTAAPGPAPGGGMPGPGGAVPHAGGFGGGLNPAPGIAPLSAIPAGAAILPRFVPLIPPKPGIVRPR